MEEFTLSKPENSKLRSFPDFFSVLEMLQLEVVHCSAPDISLLVLTGDFPR